MSLAEAEPAWRALEGSAPTLAFQTWTWVSAWQSTVGARAGVIPAVVRVDGPDGSPWMILPFGVDRGVLVWLGGIVSDYLGPLIAPACPERLLADDFPQLWRAIRAVLPRAGWARLDRQPPQISGRANPFAGFHARANPSASHQATVQGDFDAWYAARASAKTRQADRRKERRLGKVEVLIAGPDERDALLSRAIELKSAGYAALGVPDLFDEGHRELLRVVSATPLAHVSALRADGEIVATHWGLAHEGRLYILFPGYVRDERAAASPGAVLLRGLLAWAARNGLDTVDFTVGDEPYKERWCDRTTELYDSVFGLTLWGRLVASSVVLFRDAKRRVKASSYFPALLRLRARVAGRG